MYRYFAKWEAVRSPVCGQPVSKKLLIEGWRFLTGFVTIRVPISAGVGSEYLVCQNQFSACVSPEFKLCVGDDKSFRKRIGAACLIKLHTDFLNMLSCFDAKKRCGFLHTDVFVVSDIMFSRGCEDGLLQPLCEIIGTVQPDPAEVFAFLIGVPHTSE